jgi:hypothetical protein
VGISLSGLGLAVAKLAAKDGKRTTGGDGDTGERVPQVMDAYSIEARKLTEQLPRFLQIDEVGAVAMPDDNVGVIREARQIFEDANGCIIEGEGFFASFAIGQENDAAFQIDMRPFQGQNFIMAGTRKYQKIDSGDGIASLKVSPRRANSSGVRNRSILCSL